VAAAVSVLVVRVTDAEADPEYVAVTVKVSASAELMFTHAVPVWPKLAAERLYAAPAADTTAAPFT